MKIETLEDSYQLSPMQQGMLFHSLYNQNSGVDIEQLLCIVHENLNVSAFIEAWQRVIERHPVLRTSFYWEGDQEPQQYVHQQVRLPLEQQDWCDLLPKEQQERLQSYLQLDRQQGFELTEVPLMRLALFRLSTIDYQCVWTFHHALLDGRSLLLIFKEVFAFYDAICQGEDLQLEQPPCYRDHIQWLQQQNLSKAESFWRQLLQGFAAPTPLAVDQIPKPEKQGSRFGEQEIRLSVVSTSMLQSLAQQHQLTLNTLVQAAWALLLSRYSGETNVVFGATRACRHSSVARAESMVGLLINTVPVRVEVSPEMPLLPWLKELRAQWIALRDYEHTPLLKIQGWSDISNGTPLFNSLLVFENHGLNSTLRSQGGRWENVEVQLLEQTNYPLTLLGYAEPELLLKIKYDRQRFDDATIGRLLGHIQILLESMIVNPWQCLGELPLLTAAERYQMLIEWNNTQADFPKQLCIHQLFEAQVKLTPNAVAVVFEEQQLSYCQLNQQANQLAHHLKQLGVRPGVLVAIYLERSIEMIPAVLGVLKAGGAYVPLEPSFPKTRIQWLLSSLKINCVVTQTSQLQSLQNLQQQLPELKHLICLDKSQKSKSTKTEVSDRLSGSLQSWTSLYLDQLPKENLSSQASSNDVAYVIFTSGSTGTPKGVVVRHQPVINLINWVNRTFDINPTDRVLFITSLCFDLSVYDIFGLLAAGGSIKVASNHDVRDPAALWHILCNESITFWDSAPAALQQLACFSSSKCLSKNSQLRLVFLSGDWIPVTLPDAIRTSFPRTEVISLGGATEATIWSNYYPIKDVEPHWVSIPYGKPIQNAKYYILDSYLNPCPIGVSGELYIGGEVLSSGYFNQPTLTAEKFIANPFSHSSEARLYKTGDLARYLPDGNIEFLGRIDHQVKIRGFRIELGEIEAVLAQHPAVRETVILAREDEPGDKRLVGYIVVNQPTPAISELRHFLQERLPNYMIPSVFVFIDALPLTPNSKVDRRALPVPNQARPELEKAFLAPRNNVEQQLTKIWEEVLGIQRIGVKDNFFELGGHSLLALKLFAQIEKKFCKKLPLATLFEAPTVEQLASILNQKGYSARWSSLVTIQPSGSKRPFFCVHALGGNVLSYQSLVHYLGSDQPIYGLQAQGLDGKQAPFTRVEDMAAQYIKEIRTVQSQGPYLLGGHSSGGTVAFEMAQQLIAQGQKIALLAMFDTYSPQLFISNPSRFRTAYVYLRTLSRLPLKDKLSYFLEKLQWMQSMMLSKDCIEFELWNKYPLPEKLQPHEILLIESIKQATMVNYVPQVYQGKITLFRTKEELRWCHYRPHRGWESLVAGGLEIHEIPGTHLGMLEKPSVKNLAEKLRACLEQAQADIQDTSLECSLIL